MNTLKKELERGLYKLIIKEKQELDQQFEKGKHLSFFREAKLTAELIKYGTEVTGKFYWSLGLFINPLFLFCKKNFNEIIEIMQSYVYITPFFEYSNYLKDEKDIREEVRLYILNLEREMLLESPLIKQFYNYLKEVLEREDFKSITSIYFHELLHSLYDSQNLENPEIGGWHISISNFNHYLNYLEGEMIAFSSSFYRNNNYKKEKEKLFNNLNSLKEEINENDNIIYFWNPLSYLVAKTKGYEISKEYLENRGYSINNFDIAEIIFDVYSFAKRKTESFIKLLDHNFPDKYKHLIFREYGKKEIKALQEALIATLNNEKIKRVWFFKWKEKAK